MTTDLDVLKNKLQNMRVALAHDYLVQEGGAERVLAAFQRLFPNAPTFVIAHNPKRTHNDFRGKDIRTSFLNKWPLARSHTPWYLPFLPVAVEHLDFSGYDLVISSSSSFAKGIIVPANTTHICYLHTTTRFLWEHRINYLADLQVPNAVRTILPWLLHRMRQWDRLAAERPDAFLTNSETSRARIKRHYGRDATVVHPPVEVERIPMSRHEGDYWLAGGRLVAYKRFDLIVKAFSMLNMPLVIFGVGPELDKLKDMAGPKTKFVGLVNDEEKTRLYRYARGFIYPQVEDFGITAVEAMAAGRPVIAFGQGGAAETVVPGKTGTYIDAQTWEDIGDAVIRHRASDFDPAVIRQHAEKFSSANFQNALIKEIARILKMETETEEDLTPAYATYFD